MNTLIAILIFALGLTMGIAIRVAYEQNALENSHKQQVQNMCNYSSQVFSGDLEQACEDLQDKYGIEYINNNN